MFRVKLGHIILGLISLSALVSLLIYSVSALAAHEIDRRALLGQEGDASAMTFVQRESFNVLLDFHEWTVGEITTREVQISRALLGQRLGVITQSGMATFDLTDASYRSALKSLDEAIMGMSAVAEGKRAAYEKAVEASLNNFATETRYLSQTFERITRAQTAAAVADRVQAEIIQATLLGIVMIAGGALGAWVTVDIVSGFRAVQRKIRKQKENLEWTRERLLLVQKVDEKSRELIKGIHQGTTAREVIVRLENYLSSLSSDLRLEVEIVDGDLNNFGLTKSDESDISAEDLEFMKHRLHEVVQTAVTRDQQQEMLAHEREFDSLTQLPNRSIFTAEVESNLMQISVNQVAAIMLIDIDRFRDVNGSLGYEAGDVLLREVAKRLTAFASQNEQVARLSGDEFGLTGIYDSRASATERARQLLSELEFTTTIATLESLVSCSVGVAISDLEIGTQAELARCASLAIYLAKSPGERAGFTLFSPAEHSSMMTTWQEEIAVRNALRSGEFVMHFQPIVSFETHQPAGVEALIRWQRPGIGLVPPDQFLPIVNRAGLTVELGSEVIRESLASWSRTISQVFATNNLPQPYVSINVEAAQLEDAGFVDFVITQASNYHVPPSAIVLEVTEHALAGGDIVLTQLQRLRDAGIRIALDDFGTGYSNLGQAQKMPLDILKIDKSFLDAVSTDERSQRMVADVANMAKGQNLKVTVEGIETQNVADILRTMDVDYGQGYHYSKALSEQDLEIWIDTQFG